MTQPRKHRYADMIREWLNDDSLIVERQAGSGAWYEESTCFWYDKYEYRFKPKMIKCGDLEFPEPMRVAPEDGTECWVSMIADICVSILFDSADEWHLELLRKGVLHLEASDAEAHAHALIALTEMK